MSIVTMNQIDGEDIWIGGLYALRQAPTATGPVDTAEPDTVIIESTVEKAPITHVVSVMRPPLDKDLFAQYKGHHVVPVDDVEDENILEHLPAAIDFIFNALRTDGKVFIHCAMGKSRSATITCAFLMWSRQITRDEALAVIRITRPFIEPNQGFMHQLALFEQMNPKLTDSQTVQENINQLQHIFEHPVYQRWVYEQDLALSAAAGRAPERVHFRDAERKVVEIAALGEDGPDTPQKVRSVELRCKKCRIKLATSQFLAPHIPRAQPIQPGPLPMGRLFQPCSHHFIEPLLWMKDELEQGKLEGKLSCPNVKCGSKVGSYAWQGTKCSCGEWVVPGISLARSRVDEGRVSGRL